MRKSSVLRWITSGFETSWVLALLMFVNYPVTGLAFGNLQPYKNGPSPLEFDVVMGSSAALALILFGLAGKRLPKRGVEFTVGAWLMTAVTANFAPLIWAVAFYPKVEIPHLGQPVVGVTQMFTIMLTFTILIASISETRTATKSLSLQRAKLTYLSETLQAQIAEIEERLRVQVLAKLNTILSALNLKLDSGESRAPGVLANEIGEALNAGIRPLSWAIESEPAEHQMKPAQIAKPTLLKRFSYATTLNRAVNIWALFVLIAVFDLPATNYVFGTFAVAEVFLVLLTLCAIVVLLQKFVGEKVLAAWVLVLGLTGLATLVSSGFVFLRMAFGEMSPTGEEFAIVFSFTEITLLATIFQTAADRRATQIENERLVNEQLELLVSNLRQAVWVAKTRLARLVHGPIQSELFSAYLTLNQSAKLSRQQLKEIQEQIRNAADALTDSSTASPLPFEEQLDAMISGWREALSIELEVSPSVLGLISADQNAAACAIEVLREAINNAAKYASETSLRVLLEPNGNQFLAVMVTNPVSESANEATAGYGTKILNEITHRWDLKIENDQAVFTALIALNLV